MIGRRTEEELTQLQMKILEAEKTCDQRPEAVDTRVKKSNFSEDNEESLNEQKLCSQKEIPEIFRILTKLTLVILP